MVHKRSPRGVSSSQKTPHNLVFYKGAGGYAVHEKPANFSGRHRIPSVGKGCFQQGERDPQGESKFEILGGGGVQARGGAREAKERPGRARRDEDGHGGQDGCEQT
uniref:Uncharacterized protein n=1 Tax=Mus musculus TaxID=10090 RepID=Q9DC73_MOUSE|nr:unnamed protein product [Mus musculus]